VQQFVAAVLANSAAADVCSADFNLDGIVSAADVSGFVHGYSGRIASARVQGPVHACRPT